MSFPVAEAKAFAILAPSQSPRDSFPLISALMIDYFRWENEGKTPALLSKLIETIENIQAMLPPKDVQDVIEDIILKTPELSPSQNRIGILFKLPEEYLPQKNLLWCWKVKALDEATLIKDLDRHFQKWEKYGSARVLAAIQLRMSVAKDREDCPPALQEKIKQVAKAISGH